MAEVTTRIRFEDNTLHKPEFLDIHEVLQAASQPSIPHFQRAVEHLDAANYDRFVKLKEVAREQSAGNGESDLRRMKRQFASLKNTFLLYDVKQSFIEGLVDGYPNGTEDGQIQEVEEEVGKHSTDVKQYKQRNEELKAAMEQLIDSITTTYMEFSQQKADIASHLECIAAEAAARDNGQQEPLPDLPEGPDEEVCKALLAAESDRRRELEASIASQEATQVELSAAIDAEGQEINNLHNQIEELPDDDDMDTTAFNLSSKMARYAEWSEEMEKLMSALSGVSLLSTENETVHLKLLTRVPETEGAEAHEVRIAIDKDQGKIRDVSLEPNDVDIRDIVAAARNGPLRLSFVVREIQHRVANKVIAQGRQAA